MRRGALGLIGAAKGEIGEKEDRTNLTSPSHRSSAWDNRLGHKRGGDSRAFVTCLTNTHRIQDYGLYYTSLPAVLQMITGCITHEYKLYFT